MKVLWHERTTQVVALSLTLIVATAVLRKPLVAGLESENYWAAKLDWRARADCVLAGDSRVVYALAPRVIETHLAGARVLNYGFNAVAYSVQYLDAIESVIDPASTCPTIVLGITPHSLTGHAMQRSEYTWRSAAAGQRSAAGLMISRWLRWCKPMRLDTLARELNPAETSPPIMTLYEDGWLAFAPPNDSAARQLRWYENAYADGPVDGAVVDALLERVRLWVKSGIDVYGFRPPTNGAMLALEDRLSGLDERCFSKRFEDAGGYWLDVDQLAYHCPDGSHLHRDAATRFSDDIARAMQAAGHSRHASAVGE
ncbi:MAG: hypothetical protein JXO22_00230 [Phycisphaerae bacterium]|nr:hypothetical protein [Phycisphaerae bacterium]